MSKLNKDKTIEEIERDRKYRREHYYRNKPYYLAKQKKINKAMSYSQSLLISELKTPCLVCGESEKSCIDFHHINPKDKLFQLAAGRGRTRESVIAEAAKCICLCSNCHRKFHAGKLALPAGIEPALHGFGDQKATMA